MTPRVLFARLERRNEGRRGEVRRQYQLAGHVIAEIRNTMRSKETDRVWTAEDVFKFAEDEGVDELAERRRVKAQHAALRTRLKELGTGS